MDNIAVSVICNAYNHGQYIRSALDGFVMQKTNFAFEVLVHDDASTDDTAAVIREYESKYPTIIKAIYETENQYSKGDGSLTRIQYGRVRGKYCAICEGDDYWTDPLKLQKQYDALESHPEVDICAHGAFTESNGAIHGKVAPSKTIRIFTPEEVISGGGGLVVTASLMWRFSLEKNIPPFRQIIRIDYTTQIHGALRGGMLYLPDIMSVYRVSTVNSWTVRMNSNTTAYIRHVNTINAMLVQLDQDTNHQYETCIQEKKLTNQFNTLPHLGAYRKMLSPEYRECFRHLRFKKKIKVLVLALFSRHDKQAENKV